MALTDNAKGALLMMGSMAAFTVNDTFMKTLAGELPLAQAIFLRGLATSAAMLALARAMGRLRLRLPRRDLGLLALRTAGEIGAVYFFLTALFNMPLANATAILQALPLAVTLAGAVVFREPLGWRRLTAILVGFAGVLLIVRPGTEGFTIYSLYVLAAVACVTVRDLAVRRMSGALPSLTVAFVASAGVTVTFGLVAAMQPWAPVSAASAGLLLGAAGTILLAYILSVTAMRVGELAVVAPFRYTGLVVALILGYVVFGDWPTPLTLVGAALVVATGAFTLWRERQLARAAPARVPRKPRVDTHPDSL
ncbi:DMT family transporter [Rhodovulum sp. 12E13]|uniref:DMT family transporter n=1 Tax=Rhodovulum sp. 12E13 TaxID=2203891 RepID=UPI000E13D62F|nr:DMT family transporter [Rhodovulum sp. 12E13]RDC72040.1 DMT family transporter [Rhodovulum sp. 12E13]